MNHWYAHWFAELHGQTMVNRRLSIKPSNLWISNPQHLRMYEGVVLQATQH